jgi:hypothetical protein
MKNMPVQKTELFKQSERYEGTEPDGLPDIFCFLNTGDKVKVFPESKKYHKSLNRT